MDRKSADAIADKPEVSWRNSWQFVYFFQSDSTYILFVYFFLVAREKTRRDVGWEPDSNRNVLRKWEKSNLVLEAFELSLFGFSFLIWMEERPPLVTLAKQRSLPKAPWPSGIICRGMARRTSIRFTGPARPCSVSNGVWIANHRHWCWITPMSF